LHKKKLMTFLWSKRALALPVTYLILFVSLVAVISITYSFAIAKISARGVALKATIAKQNMQLVDDSIRSVAWSIGASEVVYMDDCGGAFQTAPTAKRLIINFTDETSFHEMLFSSSVGKAFYELETSDNNAGSFIRGDNRAIINQSAYSMTQLYFTTTGEIQELALCYRPSATVASVGTSDGKPLNLIRIYVINLNSSQSLMQRENFHLKITSLNITTITRQYNFNVSVSSLAIKTNFDGTLSTVWLPISSNTEGAVVNLEIVVCNVKIQKTEV